MKKIIRRLVPSVLKTMTAMLCYIVIPSRNWGVRSIIKVCPVLDENIAKIGSFYCFMGTIKGVLNYIERKTGFDNPLVNTKTM